MRYQGTSTVAHFDRTPDAAEITELLVEWSNGDEAALDKLLPLVERELHRIAHYYMQRMRPGHTLQTTALINETYLLLVKQNRATWQNRAHFFGIAAKMMRRILLNYIRDGRRIKRGGNAIAISLSDAAIASKVRSEELISLDEALTRLEAIDERKSQVVELRFFGGLTVAETAVYLKVSKITVIRDWIFAKAWLLRELTRDESS